MKGFGYIRVSTKEQDEEVQRKSIIEFCKSRGIEIVEFFVDKGESGAKPFAERPASKQLLLRLNENPIPVDVIVVWSIDRLGRSMIDTLNTVMMIEDKGVKIISIKEEWLQTLDQNMRKLILSILSWFAEFERRRIRERQLEAWRQGKQKGRPRKLKTDVLEKYLKKYSGLKITALLKILRADGYEVSYATLRRYLKELKKGVVEK